MRTAGERHRVRQPCALEPTTRIATVAGALLLIACDTPHSALRCSSDSKPAIRLEVRDAVTGAPAAWRTSGIVRDGDYVDSLWITQYTASDSLSALMLAAASERPGTYAIELRPRDYALWDTVGVQVTANECHVETAWLKVTPHRIR